MAAVQNLQGLIGLAAILLLAWAGSRWANGQARDLLQQRNK